MYVLIAALLAAPAVAGEEEEGSANVPVVVVPGARVASWPYRTLAKGLEAFEEHRAMAPAALLRFRMRPHKGVTDFSGVTVHLEGDGWQAPLAVHPDGRFVLPANARAQQDDAAVVINRNRSQFDPRTIPLADVRTPGLADNVVRMGDVRLECEVNQAIAKKQLGFVWSLALTAVAGPDWCDRRDGKGHSARPPHAFTRAVLAEGERRAVLYEGRERGYLSVPIQDKSWSDEARVEFTTP